ncbi:MAG: HlyD family type I secretion periplasmic adaptor subunit [Anderseniella sp.]|jgi:HlyD family secretion protein|nr:HlyD family type I secretion periplasmic adaptor subunit [Anderseniella sp.]
MSGENTAHNMRRYQIIGFAGLFLVMGSVAGWAALSEIRGAVIASGQLVVDGNTKRIQHRDGGIVAEILVKDGDLVKAGDLLLRLDDTDARAELGIIETIRAEWLAKGARLKAERDGASQISFPAELLARQDQPVIAELLEGQERLFTSQKASVDGRVKQLDERIEQLNKEIAGIEAQLLARQQQRKLISKELRSMQQLLEKGLVQVTRVLALEREQARLDGETGQHEAQIARARGQISEIRVQILQIKDDAQTKTLGELREAEAKVAEFDERRIAVAAKLKRVDIRSPRDGYVHQLAVHTIGGVIGAGDPVMIIVPEEDPLIVEVKVRPQDIDQVHAGQEAVMRFPNAVSSITPQISGEVLFVSADLKQPEPNEPPFYTVRLQLSEGEAVKLNGLELKAGMPAEAHMQTASRSPLSYLLKPFRDQLQHAMRER